jgi:predicted acylesterase/phospholipase RssA
MNTPSAILTLFFLGLAGCVSAAPSSPATVAPSPTHANQVLDQEVQRDGRFIGLAISGGGSRAAVFGGAVLLELHRLGLLQQVDMLSAVSGGTLPAAYYALDGYRAIDFENGFMERVGYDFQREMRNRFLSPGNLLTYWFTDATKSDTVVQVLDEQLFHGATYADLNPARPKLLLNATNALTGDPLRDFGRKLCNAIVAVDVAPGRSRGVYVPQPIRGCSIRSYYPHRHRRRIRISWPLMAGPPTILGSRRW